MRILIITAVLVAALGGGYIWLIKYTPEATETPFVAEIRQKIDAYQKIHELSPNLSVFDDALFRVLKPVERLGAPAGAATTSVRAGRDNPFVPF